MEGRVRRLRGSPVGETAEAQTAQSQPSVGMPIEVPEPRNVRVACIRLSAPPAMDILGDTDKMRGFFASLRMTNCTE